MSDMYDPAHADDTEFGEDTAAHPRLVSRVVVLVVASALAATSFVPALGCLVSGLPFEPPRACPVQRAP